jgi:hypothetical protein
MSSHLFPDLEKEVSNKLQHSEENLTFIKHFRNFLEDNGASNLLDFWEQAQQRKERDNTKDFIAEKGNWERRGGGRRPEARGRRQEAGGRRQEAGGRRQEAGGRRQEGEFGDFNYF